MDQGTRDVQIARRKRIDGFALRQEDKRKFVSVAKLIEFHATEQRGIDIDEGRRRRAYEHFATAALNGFFERRTNAGTKTQILLLSEHAPAMRLSRERLLLLSKCFDPEVLISAYLSCCWLESDDALRWCISTKMAEAPNFWEVFRPPLAGGLAPQVGIRAGWTDEDVEQWLRRKENELRRRPPIRCWSDERNFWKEKRVTKPRFEEIWRKCYPDSDRGRPPKLGRSKMP
ncbi:MAG TPA: hypothetical protein VIF34_10190 [Methylocystis sp.]|jgi:hypothetical protein